MFYITTAPKAKIYDLYPCTKIFDLREKSLRNFTRIPRVASKNNKRFCQKNRIIVRFLAKKSDRYRSLIFANFTINFEIRSEISDGISRPSKA
jgi:hypothetical protein